MRSRWTLAVEGLGPIDRAEVEVRPLTMFVGDNNSGKSYLTSLLWDFYARMPEVFSFHDAEMAALEASTTYQNCRQWLVDKFDRSEPYELTEDDKDLLLSWFNERLSAAKGSICGPLFERDMAIGALSLRRLGFDAAFSIQCKQVRHGGRPGDVTYIAHGYAPGEPRRLEIEIVSRDDMLSHANDPEIILTIVAQMISPVRAVNYRYFLYEGNNYVPGDPVFLPASRTSFVLLYRYTLAQRASQRFASSVPLTLPQGHFLQLIAFGLKAGDKGPYSEEADVLERHAFPGTVALKGGIGVNEIEYRYDPAAPPLPMQLAASLVTELAPLVLVLRHASELPVLILEEPETHLHPHIIRLVARVVTRLVRKGVQVCITTHSPDFCQQINTFIKLGSLPPDERARFQAQYGYEADDYLDEKEVAGYEFQVGANGRSSVTRLDESPSGLAMPTFNVELIGMSKEVLELNRAIGGDA